MNLKNIKYFIIVDGRGVPLSFSEKDQQLCYCTHTTRHLLVIVSKSKAKEHIRITKKNRKKWGYKVGEYTLMPVLIDKNLDTKHQL